VMHSWCPLDKGSAPYSQPASQSVSQSVAKQFDSLENELLTAENKLISVSFLMVTLHFSSLKTVY
jgi:hypothetical protein